MPDGTLLDDVVGMRYRSRLPRKGRKVVSPVYPTEMRVTRRLLRDCKLKKALERLLEEAFKRMRRNHNASKREERHPDDRKVEGQVICVVLHSFKLRPLVEVPEDYKNPMSMDEGE